jgi:drug/metabolite transporter (DMT)-like permease
VRALLWSTVSGLIFVLLNTLMRQLAQELNPFQTQFLRYMAGVLVMVPFVWRSGFRPYLPYSVGSHAARGAVHTVGLTVWFFALPRISLADTTAIGFTAPIFVMIGAVLVFKEPMRWERWLAALVGFCGVLIVVAPNLRGDNGLYTLVMLASSPIFAASSLMTKALTRHERTEVIVVWQAISVMACSMPLALLAWQWPSARQLLLFLLCGCLGSAGHFCLTRSFSTADISATQSVKFLDLVWAAALGFAVFGDIPAQTTIIGGVVIAASTLWIARREARGRAPA